MLEIFLAQVRHHERVSVDTLIVTSDDSIGSSDAAALPKVVDLAPDALELARAAAVEESADPALIGEFLQAYAEDEVAISARFATADAAYTGWSWCVTLAVLADETPTVSEVVLLPGPGALLPPEWLPWNERIRPGDLGPGDLLPTTEDDIRLTPAYVQSDDPAVEDVAHELGIGRVHVMSRFGRIDAAERWREGEFGPDTEMAKAAPGKCRDCGFYLPLAGSLGIQSGACGNEMSPADGRVVDTDFGCGAHSELAVELIPSGFGDHPIDEVKLEVHSRPSLPAAAAAELVGEDTIIDEDADDTADADDPADTDDTAPAQIETAEDATTESATAENAND